MTLEQKRMLALLVAILFLIAGLITVDNSARTIAALFFASGEERQEE